jgi:hypothetical protein
MKKYLLILFFLAFGSIAFAQNNIDSLSNKLLQVPLQPIQKELILTSKKATLSNRKFRIKKSFNDLLKDKIAGLRENIFFEAVETRTKEVLGFVKATL